MDGSKQQWVEKLRINIKSDKKTNISFRHHPNRKIIWKDTWSWSKNHWTKHYCFLGNTGSGKSTRFFILRIQMIEKEILIEGLRIRLLNQWLPSKEFVLVIKWFQKLDIYVHYMWIWKNWWIIKCWFWWR